MEDLKNMSMEEKKEVVQVHMGLLKKMLMETGLIIAFDKTNNKFLFLDRELYISEMQAKGFEIDFKDLTY